MSPITLNFARHNVLIFLVRVVRPWQIWVVWRSSLRFGERWTGEVSRREDRLHIMNGLAIADVVEVPPLRRQVLIKDVSSPVGHSIARDL